MRTEAHREPPPPAGLWENSRFSGQAPSEILYPDQLLDSVASHCPQEEQGGGTSLGGCGGGKAWGTWGGPGRGRKRPHSSHKHGCPPPPRVPGAQQEPPSISCLLCPPAQEASTSLPSPESPPLAGRACGLAGAHGSPSPVVWEVPGSWMPSPPAPGSSGPFRVSLWPDTQDPQNLNIL